MPRGITLTAAGQYNSPFTITGTGTISAGANSGVVSALVSPALINAGFIASSLASGVYFTHGGTVSNTSSTAQITGGAAGIKIDGAAGAVINNGTIAGNGNQNLEVYLYAGNLTNAGTASAISGYGYGVEI